MQDVTSIHAQTAVAQSSSSKVLRNTYMLLGMTLAFSSVCAGISMAANIGYGLGLVMSLVAMGLIWFVLPRTANSSAGLLTVFAFTGLIGAGLGPVLNHYLKMANGGAIILQALAATGAVFLGLSAYVLTTRKNFSFMGGFIAAGMMLMLVMMFFLMGASLFGYQLSVLNLVYSAGVALLMCALIVYETSEIIHGGETNYIMATTSLFLSIVNLFSALLRLLGAASDD